MMPEDIQAFFSVLSKQLLVIMGYEGIELTDYYSTSESEEHCSHVRIG